MKHLSRFLFFPWLFLMLSPAVWGAPEQNSEEVQILNEEPPLADTSNSSKELSSEEVAKEEKKKASEEIEWLPIGADEQNPSPLTATPIVENLTPKALDPAAGLKGFQGQYETDLFTGSATFTLPFWIPSGRNGMNPVLNLSYSSSNSNLSALLGPGWTLAQNAIYRSTAKGVDRLYAENDFSAELFGNFSELISINTTQGKYAAKIEGAFSDYTFQNNAWTMKDTKGTVFTFGSSAATRQADPAAPTRVYKWLLERVEDRNGNFMTFSYATDLGQVYPDKIRYTGKGSDSGNYEIRFQRETRTFAPLSYNTGFKVQTAQRLKRLEVFQLVPAPQLVRAYDFSYQQEKSIELKLASIIASGGTETLPPLRFSYFDTGPSYGLLRQVEYPNGGKQMIAYQASTAYRLNPAVAANPKLPFIIQTVHTTSVQAGASDPVFATTYEYSGGHYYFDAADTFTREYAGFQMVKISDPVGNIRKLFFHQSEFASDNVGSSTQGEYQDHISKKGHIYREEMFDSQGKLFQATIRKWGKTALPEDDPKETRNFPFLSRETNVLYDGNASAKSTSMSFTYDSYGNILSEIDSGEVNLTTANGDFSDMLTDKITTTNEYIQNTSAGIFTLRKRQVRRDFNNIVIGETKAYYDGLPLGQVDKGNETKTETLVVAPGTYLTTSATYDTYGLPLTITNARGKTTAITYDATHIFPATVTNPKNQTTTFVYDPGFGIPILITDPNGLKTVTEFDSLGRITATKVSDPAAPNSEVRVAKYEYDLSQVPNSLTQTTFRTSSGEDQMIKTYFDGFGRPIQVRQEAEGTNRFQVSGQTYDERGNVKKEFLPVFQNGSAFNALPATSPGTEFTYDALNRTIAARTTLGVTTTTYDNWIQTATDSNGKRKDLRFDARQNLVEVKEYLGATPYSTLYTYNSLNQLTQIRDAKGDLRNMSSDLLGRRLTLEDLHLPSDSTFGTWRFTYDANGNLISQIDPKSQTVLFSYDDLDRVLTEDFSDAAGTEISYGYDQGTYGIGRLATLTTADIQKNYGYDLLGRIVSEHKVIAGESYDTAFTYDLAGNIVSLEYPDQMRVSYEYNSAGLLETVKKDGVSIVTNLDFAPVGLPEKIEYANGVSTQNNYDISQLWRLTRRETSKGSAKLQDISYNFDPVGNITRIVDASASTAAKTADYLYDDLHRLTRATISATANNADYTHTYSYDILGNIVNRSDRGNYSYAGGSPSTSSGTTSNPHAVTTIGTTNYAYDANGNLTSNETWNHSWDYRDRLASSTDGTQTISYYYDEAGQRILKEDSSDNSQTVYVNQYYVIENDIPKKFIYAGDLKVATETLLEETSENTAPVSEKESEIQIKAETEGALGENLPAPENSDQEKDEDQITEEEPSGEKSSEEVLPEEEESEPSTTLGAATLVPHLIYHHEDHLTGANVDTDESGVIIQLLDYYPYGNVRIDEKSGNYENDYKFTGKELDEDTDLYYYEARYYDAKIGRFLSLDPWEGDLTDPQSLNKYAYARNNPLKYIDPTGKVTEIWIRHDSVGAWNDFGHALVRIAQGDYDQTFGFFKNDNNVSELSSTSLDEQISRYKNTYDETTFSVFKLDINLEQEFQLKDQLESLYQDQSQLPEYNLVSNNCTDFVAEEALGQFSGFSDLKDITAHYPDELAESLFKNKNVNGIYGAYIAGDTFETVGKNSELSDAEFRQTLSKKAREKKKEQDSQSGKTK